jgi:shikimate dehydrogenase
MLVAQAKEAAEWFTGRAIDDTIIMKIHRQLKLQMENIILIGMPGSGKSTVGRLLAKKLARYFVDADEAIIKEAGMPIPEIFATSGEEGFRQIETKVLARLGQESSLVIATGGGCVTRRENDPLLHQNGICVWLARDLEKLPTEGRPLSQQTKLEQMYQIRKPLYTQFADYTADNNATPEECTKQILELLNLGGNI